MFVDLHLAPSALAVVCVSFAPHCSALHKSGAGGKKASEQEIRSGGGLGGSRRSWCSSLGGGKTAMHHAGQVI